MESQMISKVLEKLGYAYLWMDFESHHYGVTYITQAEDEDNDGLYIGVGAYTIWLFKVRWYHSDIWL